MSTNNRHCQTDESGFSSVELFLVLVIVAVIGFVGWYVWHSKQVTDKNYATSNSQASFKNNAPTDYESCKKAPGSKLLETYPEQCVTKAGKSFTQVVDQTATWQSYQSADGKFSLKYPATWVQPQSQDFCGDFLRTNLEIGPNLSSVIKCGSDGTVSQVSVQSTAGNTTKDKASQFSSELYSSKPVASITIDGVAGSRYEVTRNQMSANEGAGDYPAGTIIIQDVLYSATTSRTYSITYTQEPASSQGPNTDQSAIFKLLVGTLQFK